MYERGVFVKIKRSAGSVAADVVIYGILLLYTLCTLVPLLYVVLQSFASTTTTLIPRSLTTTAYEYVFSNSTFIRSMGISVYVTLMGTFLSMLVTCLMAYALSRRELLGRKFFMLLVVFTMMFNGGMIPTFLVVRSTGIMDTYWSLILPSLINTFNLIVLKNFFQGLPEELRESAMIDGCSDWRNLFSIVLPLSVPALATFVLFYAVAKWNLYFDALLYIRTPQNYPVQVLLRQVLFVSTGAIGEGGSEASSVFTSQSVRSAVVVVSTVPILLVYPFLQRYFTTGLLVGSVKG